MVLALAYISLTPNSSVPWLLLVSWFFWRNREGAWEGSCFTHTWEVMEWCWNPDLPDSTTYSSEQCLHQLKTYLTHIPGIKTKGDCNHEIKKRLLPGGKAMTSPESIVKIRDITLPTKVHLVKAMVFPVVMYGCESWTIKKAERWRIDVFELRCWRRLESLGLQGDRTSPS